MEVGTLEELKRENAAAEAATTEEIDGGQQDSDNATDDQEEHEEAEALDTDAELDDSESDEDEETSEEEEVESWLVGDEQTSQEESGSDGVPVKKHVQMKHKLKATISQQETELEKLKRENEALKNGTYKPEQQTAAQQKVQVPRPKASDYTNEYGEFDAGSFDTAMEQWQQQFSQSSQQQYEQQAAAETQKKQLESTVNSHYEQAGKLVESGVVSEEDFKAKDLLIRQTLEGIGASRGQAGQGDQLADWLVSQISLVAKGEDAAKLHYKLGASPTALQEVINAYTADTTGGAGVAKLAELSRSVTKPVKRRSKAPKPATQVNGGGEMPSGQGKNDMRRYREAHKKGDLQTAFNLKRQAKNSGVDVSKW